jgi:hypothetical protein
LWSHFPIILSESGMWGEACRRLQFHTGDFHRLVRVFFAAFVTELETVR